MSYSTEAVRQGLILLVDYLKSVHGRSVAKKIREATGRNYSPSNLQRINPSDRVVFPILEFAGIRPGDFYTFVANDSFGYLPLYLYEIERLCPSQIRSLQIQLAHRRRHPRKRTSHIPILDLEKQRFRLSPKVVADCCWATIGSSNNPVELHEAWAILSTISRGQAKYSRSAFCARQALSHLHDDPLREAKVLQRIAYLALHLCDSKPAVDLTIQARLAYKKGGDQRGLAQTYIDEAKVHCFRCDYAQAANTARVAEQLLAPNQLVNWAALHEIYGLAALYQGDLDKAWEVQRSFSNLVRSHPTLDIPYWNAYADYLRAQTLVAKGHFREASALFEILNADLSNSLPTGDRILIVLQLMLCHIGLGRLDEIRPLSQQTRAYLESLTPQTSAIRKYYSLLSHLERHAKITQRLVRELIQTARLPPPTNRRKGQVIKGI